MERAVPQPRPSRSPGTSAAALTPSRRFSIMRPSVRGDFREHSLMSLRPVAA